jgi:hypothetical protein
MSEVDVSGPGWTAFECRVAVRLRKELHEALGYDP